MTSTQKEGPTRDYDLFPPEDVEQAFKLFEELCTPDENVMPDELGLDRSYDELVAIWIQLISESKHAAEKIQPHHTWEQVKVAIIDGTAHLLKAVPMDDCRVERFIQEIGLTPLDYLKDRDLI